MARDIYSQPVDNPLRFDRLPQRRPKTILPGRIDPRTRRAVHKQLATYYLAILLAVLAIVWLVPPLGNMAVLAVYFFYVGRKTVQSRDYRWVTLTWPVPAAIAISLIGTVNRTALCVVASAILGRLCWSYGRHWTAYCTVSPMPRADAEVLCRHWAHQILVFSMLIPIAGIVAAVTGQSVLFSLLIGSAVTTQLVLAIHGNRGRPVLAVARQVIGCWLTHNPNELRIPGLLSSPAGPWRYRVALTAACLLLTSIALVGQWPPVGTIAERPDATAELSATAPLANLPLVVSAFLLPVVITTVLPVALTLSVLADAARRISGRLSGRAWTDLVDGIRQSTDPIERRSIYRGRNAADGSPVLVPCKIFGEHAHFLGDTGGGKTSLGLMPTYEQLLSRGDCSVIVIDLKADTLEHLATLEAAARVARRLYGVTIRVKRFTNQTGLGTYSFNPLMQPFWRDLELYMRTDILCGATGLTYGPDYGQGFFGSANAACLYHTLKVYPEASTFRELADAIGFIIASAKKHELHSEIKKAGVHLQEVIKRLAASKSLNVDSPIGNSNYAINLADVFTEPQAIYFHLSSSLAPGSSPEIARLVAYLLLCAASRVERRHPVYLVIDEFQRMVASNVEYMLQLARSMGVGIILANQSLQDLRRSNINFIPAIEANCRYREWYSVSASDDRDNLIDSSGETIDLFRSFTTTTGDRSSTSLTQQERLVPRLSKNHILLASDHPMRSIVKITRGDGYAQYGGMPFITEHDFHITAEEYERRRSYSWPEPEEGMLIAGHHDPEDDTPPAPGPSSGSSPTQPPQSPVTTEVIRDEPSADDPIDRDLFSEFQDDSVHPGKSRPKRRRRKRSRHNGSSPDDATPGQPLRNKNPD